MTVLASAFGAVAVAVSGTVVGDWVVTSYFDNGSPAASAALSPNAHALALESRNRLTKALTNMIGAEVAFRAASGNSTTLRKLIIATARARREPDRLYALGQWDAARRAYERILAKLKRGCGGRLVCGGLPRIVVRCPQGSFYCPEPPPAQPLPESLVVPECAPGERPFRFDGPLGPEVLVMSDVLGDAPTDPYINPNGDGILCRD